MANRVVIAADITTYGSSNPLIMLGDIILNTRSSSHTDGRGLLFITDAATQFPTARMGCNIWFDGTALGIMYNIKLNNGGTEPTDYWDISDENNYVNYRVIEGTKLRVIKNSVSNSGYGISLTDIKYSHLHGINNTYTGLSKWGTSGSPTFLTGNFAIHVSGGTGGHQLQCDANDGGCFKITGIELEQGFSAIRFAQNVYDKKVAIQIEGAYLHDAINGEGFYLGSTHEAPFAKLKNVWIRNCVVVRRAAEALQIQHLINENDATNLIENCVLWGSMDWLNAFQSGQSTNTQWVCDHGNSTIQNSIMLCAASVGVNTFGPSTASLAIAGGSTLASPSDPPALMKNCLYYDCRGVFNYIHNSTVGGVKWLFEDVYALGFNELWYYNGLNNPDLHYISNNNGTDERKFINFTHDGVKPTIFENTSNKFEIIGTTLNTSLPAPQFVNTGAYEPHSYWMNWHYLYANYHDGPNDTPVLYYQDWIVADIHESTVVNDLIDYYYYKVINTHTSAGIRPNADPTNFLRLTWDSNGVRSDQGGWTSGGYQSNIPPDDFRLVANNYWNIKGMGLLSNQPNTTLTQYQWFRADDNIGTNAYEIIGAKNLTYTPVEEDVTKYIRCGIKVVDSFGNTDTSYKYSNWTLVDGYTFIDIGNTAQTINGVTYSVQSAELAWSINKSTSSGNIYRFKVNEGECRSSESGKERSELSNGAAPFNHGTSIWAAYSFKVESGDALTGTTQVLGQFHAGVGSPNLSFRLPYDDTLEVVLRTGDSDAYTETVPYTNTSFIRGNWYHVVINTMFTHDTTGFTHIWINGIQVVNLNSFYTGYLAAQSTSNYWKFGIYRSTSTYQTEIVLYSNMELGTTDLSARITTPLLP